MASPHPVAWYNGSFLPLSEVRISPLDRGFLFADSIYEVIPVFAGRPFLLEAHLARLDAGLAGTGIGNPCTDSEWRALVSGLVERNGGGTMAVYLQVTRGADAGRDHRFPDRARVAPNLFAMASPVPDPHPDQAGIRAITLPDQRWARCDLKSTGLLPNVLARQAAHEAGTGEALLLRDGVLTEASTSSVIVVEKDVLLRRPAGRQVLPGTTIDAVVECATRAGYECRAELVSETRLRAADEIWVAAATRGVIPVTQLDGAPVGTGRPGPVWARVAPLFEAIKRGD
ncbi:MAG: aminotransferase class IV [Chromatiales bacterium]|nr:aminotransferase class IV [Chromatiales bacterium]